MSRTVKKPVITDRELKAWLNYNCSQGNNWIVLYKIEEMVSHQDLTYFETTFSVKKIRSSISKENNIFWLAFVDDLPIGYAKLKKYSPVESVADTHCAQLQKIYVLKDFIGKQVGPLLQEALFNEFKQLGIKNLWLSVLKTNYRAIRFYEKNEFKPVGEHLFSIGKETFDFHILLKKFT